MFDLLSGTAAMLLVIVWKPYTGFLSISAILRYIHLWVILIHLRNSLCDIFNGVKK